MISYDQKINNLFYYWLLSIFFLVFLMVIVGGLTRLTDSGLSITEWELFTGFLPPLDNKTWNEYFALYKEIPQYRLIFNEMTIEEFKIIFYWEYFHRFLGRLIGLFFLIPLIFFHFYGKINKKYIYTCYLIFILIVTQGVVGWFMVKSGLINNITVSHYRLSMHLTLAFLIISILFWLILNFKENVNNKFIVNNTKNYKYYFLLFMIYLQIVFGAFVSGLDAGKLYQTWPLMNYTYFPDDVIITSFKDLFNFKNHGLVQFYHRNIAYFITIYILLLGFFIYKKDKRKLFKPFVYSLIFLFFQVFLGIVTLMSGLNIYLASAHQICSVLLILSVINLYYFHIK